ncbi:putative repeat protein (TIGR01451 family) [Diaminobutyricimonas aerilata]|uniref:Putative repeat protein (TIGR01451 family) n=1 Tax=Diaminobutyricimonas aerilata TaxID=1162967 RepID=A0A2M9CMG6_9MICO|nr:putative repeat protein (TIGR01451 family) [Diaminobutyricimonas aerilata]
MISAVLSLGLAVSGFSGVALLASPTPAEAAPGTPGTPQPNTAVFSEGFENGVANTPVLLTAYTGASGQKYTADNVWLTACNGLVVNFNAPYTSMGNCAQPSSSSATRQLAYALGAHVGSATPQTNHAVTAYTEGNPGANAIEFRTVSNIPLASTSGRFLTFSVDAAAANCFATAPQYQFAFLNQAGVATNVGGQLNACTSTKTVTTPAVGVLGPNVVNVGTYTSNGSVLFNGTSLGVQMRNANGSGTGNDAAFDNIRILDVTPQLDKSFVATTVAPNQPTPLTFTVTNTAELAAKNGWSFTDTLPAGVRLATPTAAVTTCPAGTVTAAAGGTSITAAGNLTAGLASCTITVNVVASAAGTYTNGPANVTTTGLNAPGDSTLTVAVPPSLRCSVATNGSFESPNIQDPANPVAGDAYQGGYNQFRTSQGTISGWQTVAGTIDILRYYNNASDGAQSIDLWGTAPATIQQTFSGLIPGGRYTFSLDYSGMETTSSRATVQLSQGGAFSTLATLAPTTNAVSNGTSGTPTRPSFTVAWANSSHTFTATGTTATVRIQNQTAPSSFNTGLFIDNFKFSGAAPCEDFGDAPESYGTSIATNGPAHIATGPTIGAARDAEADGQPNATATGDDAAGTPDDEDGIGAFVFPAGATTVTVPVAVSNPGTTAATLYGWIDANRDGRFEATEFASVPVPGGATTANLTFAGQPTDGAPRMMRLRLTTDALADVAATPAVDERSVGTASNGEVEDHLVTVGPGITLTKTATPASAGEAGDDIQFSFLVTNIGGVTLTDVAIDEGAFTGTGELSDVVCPAGAASLAPGATVTCTAAYELTQADVDAGSLTNTATATGVPPTGSPSVSPPSTAVVQVPPTPGLSVVKSATPSSADEFRAGQEIEYRFVVTNTGNTTLTDVSVDEGTFTGTGDLSAIDCPAGAASMAPDAQITCTATYILTQADVDAGSVSNSATATGTPPSGTPPVSPPSEFTIPTPPVPGISVVKSAAPITSAEAGDEIEYSFLVTNTGNVTLTEIAVDEGDFSGTGDLSAIDCPAGAASLIPGARVTCTATYELTQADIDAGTLSNSATATGVPPSGTPPVSPPSEVTIELPPTPAMTVAKTATPATAGEVGDEITYSFLVTNTGNVTLTDVTVAEGAFSGTGDLSDVVCPAGAASLAPGDDVTCTATYTLTQADVDAGSVSNSATATGTPPGTTPPPTSPPSEVIVEIPPAPAITVTKTATPATAGAVGDEITYSFLVTNTGSVTLTDVAVVEGEFSGTGDLSDVVCPAGAASLAPGDGVTCTATYVLTQADVDAGEVTNSATATGVPPTGTPPVSPPSENTVEIPSAAAITVAKTATPATAAEAGDEITYSFLVTNTGNVTLTEIAVDEGDFSGTGDLSEIVCPAGAASLAPGDDVTCTATYTLTQADVDAGSVTNSATATGVPPTGTPPVSPPSEVTVEIPPAPGLSVVKSATPSEQVDFFAGQEVTYSFVVTNTGNTTLTDVSVDEGEFTGTGDLSDIVCPAGAATLAPDAQVTCTATYVVTQADVDSGSVTNSATATGVPPTGTPPTSPPSEFTIPTPALPGITVVKSATPTTAAELGDEIEYSFLVENTGNVTLTDVTVVEGEFSGTGELSAIECPADVSLLPGERLTCTATYTLTQADVDAGSVTNSATATGVPPTGTPPVSPPSEVTVEIPPAPALAVTKTATPTTAGKAGDVITYAFRIENTGNVTLTNVAVTEGAFTGTGELSEIVCPTGAASLAPGADVTCTATYTLTQADVDAGAVTNSATATGTPPGGGTPPVSPPSEFTVEIPPAPGIRVVKSASPDTEESFLAGQVIEYSFVVTNTGNVTLADVTVDDSEFTGTGELSDVVCPEAAASLAPGAQVTCTATYTLTQADVDTGEVSNSATATGTPPSGTPPVSPPSEIVIPNIPAPALTLVKTSDADALTGVGQVIGYEFEVENTGNVTLSDIAIEETEFSGSGELSVIECPADPLLPGGVATCVASYEVTQADLDAGELSNTATASGLSPDGTTRTVSAESTRDIPFAGSSALELVKSSTVIDVNRNDVTDPGDRIRWSFVVRNTGLTTVSEIGVNDPTGGPVTCPATILPPGGSMDCTTVEDRTITAADVRTGSVVNSATATGTGLDGTVITSNVASATVTVVATPVPPLAVTGGTVAVGALVTALGGLVTGALLLILRRRRTA